MTFNRDISICACKHGWASHLINGKVSACSFNQKLCSCWIYSPKKMERREIFDLEIQLNTKGEKNKMIKRDFVQMHPTEKSRIVERVERRFVNFIIDPARKNCLEGCRCEICFQKALDALVVKTEVRVKASILGTWENSSDEQIEWI